MVKAAMVVRIFLGLVFVVSGLNGFFQFIPAGNVPEKAMAFAGALGASGYFFPMLKGIETLCGVALLSNRYVPLALTILAPIVVNILMFHIFLAPAGLLLAIPITAAEIFLACTYCENFHGVVQRHAVPGVCRGRHGQANP